MALEPIDVVVVGGANTDFLVRGPSLPKPGSTVEGDEFQTAPGGKGANQAVAAAASVRKRRWLRGWAPMNEGARFSRNSAVRGSMLGRYPEIARRPPASRS